MTELTRPHRPTPLDRGSFESIIPDVSEILYAASLARDSGFTQVTIDPIHVIALIRRLEGAERELASIPLTVYEFGEDTWVAASVADLKQQALAFYGYSSLEALSDDGYSDEDLAVIDNDVFIKIVCDLDGHPTDDRNFTAIAKTAADWAKQEGRGLLCSPNC